MLYWYKSTNTDTTCAAGRLKKDEFIHMLVEKARAENPSFLEGVLDIDAEKEAGGPPPPSKKKKTTELSRLNWGREEEEAEVRIGSEGQGVIQVVIKHKESCKEVSGQVGWNESFGASGLLDQSRRVWGGGVSAQVLSLLVVLVQNCTY